MDQPTRTGRRPGLVVRLLTRRAVVSGIEAVAPDFAMVSIAGEALKGALCEPGCKIQIHFGGMRFRTYTPTEWDAGAGTARFLAYVHGDGPAGRWLRTLKVGDDMLLHGPRRSLDLGGEEPMLFVGDETAIGAAVPLRQRPATRFLFEATQAGHASQALAALGFERAAVAAREAEDAHHPALEREALRLADEIGARRFVLAGKAQTIQRLSRALKGRGVPGGAIRAKAYWAPGKTGLD